jgi:hypothetical protein
MGGGSKMYKFLVGKLEGKKSLGSPRRRWKDGIKMDLMQVGWRVWSGFTCLGIKVVGGLL